MKRLENTIERVKHDARCLGLLDTASERSIVAKRTLIGCWQYHVNMSSSARKRARLREKNIFRVMLSLPTVRVSSPRSDCSETTALGSTRERERSYKRGYIAKKKEIMKLEEQNRRLTGQVKDLTSTVLENYSALEEMSETALRSLPVTKPYDSRKPGSVITKDDEEKIDQVFRGFMDPPGLGRPEWPTHSRDSLDVTKIVAPLDPPLLSMLKAEYGGPPSPSSGGPATTDSPSLSLMTSGEISAHSTNCCGFSTGTHSG